AALRASRFECETRPDIMRWKYRKLLGNLGNAVQVVIAPGEPGREAVRLAREEGTAVLRAAGIDTAQVATALGATRPVGGNDRLGGSSYQSLQRGTGTIESDYLNGEIVLLGREHGVPTPVNELLRRLANQMAREGRSPGLMTPEEFLATLDGHASR
ncbi:MAG: ketopantoate reductase family protein, partial [Actinoallomurus sp.]